MFFVSPSLLWACSFQLVVYLTLKVVRCWTTMEILEDPSVLTHCCSQPRNVFHIFAFLSDSLDCLAGFPAFLKERGINPNAC